MRVRVTYCLCGVVRQLVWSYSDNFPVLFVELGYVLQKRPVESMIRPDQSCRLGQERSWVLSQRVEEDIIHSRHSKIQDSLWRDES